MTTPAISIQNLNSELASVTAKFDLLSVANTAQNAVVNFATAVETKLGTQVGQVVGGFQSLTQELDDVVSFVGGKPITLSVGVNASTGLSLNVAPAQDLAASLSGFSQVASSLNAPLENASGVMNKGIALLAENPPGLNIKKETSASNSDLEALTEDTVEGGFLEFSVTAATPEAIAKTLNKVTNESVQAISSAISDIAPGIVGIASGIQSIIAPVLNGISLVSNLVNNVVGFISNTVQALTQGLTGFVNNLIESVAAPFQSVIDNITTGLALPFDINIELKGIIELGDIGRAAELLQGYSNIPISEIESKLLAIPTSLSSMLSNNKLQVSISTPVNIIGGR